MKATYKKKNGEIITKISDSTQYNIGEENSWGWVLISKEYLWKGKYISSSEYDRLIQKSWERDKKLQDFKNTLNRLAKDFIYFAIIMLFIKFIIFPVNGRM